MGSPIIFFGNAAKLLKAKLNLSSNSSIESGSTDPSSVATDGNKGSLYLNNSSGVVYIKQDNGTTTNWQAITPASGATIQDWNTQSNFTVSAGFGTISQDDFTAARVNDTLYVRGSFTTGTVTSGLGEIILPAGLVIDTSKLMPNGFEKRVGTMNIGTTSSVVNNTTELVIFSTVSGTDRVYVSYHAASGVFQNDPVNSYLAGNEPLYFDFNVPIVGWGLNNGQDYT